MLISQYHVSERILSVWVSHHMAPVSALRDIFHVAQKENHFEELSDVGVRNRQ